MGNEITADKIEMSFMYEAPPELIWQLWTDPEHFKQWYGPRGFTVPVAQWDLQVGGKRLVCMQGETPNGPMIMWTTGEYTEISPYTRLSFTEGFSDENGNPKKPVEMGFSADQPDFTVVTVVLEDLGGITKMTMTHSGVDTSAQGAVAGWMQAFDKMAEYVIEVVNAR